MFASSIQRLPIEEQHALLKASNNSAIILNDSYCQAEEIESIQLEHEDEFNYGEVTNKLNGHDVIDEIFSLNPAAMNKYKEHRMNVAKLWALLALLPCKENVSASVQSKHSEFCEALVAYLEKHYQALLVKTFQRAFTSKGKDNERISRTAWDYLHLIAKVNSTLANNLYDDATMDARFDYKKAVKATLGLDEAIILTGDHYKSVYAYACETDPQFTTAFLSQLRDSGRELYVVNEMSLSQSIANHKINREGAELFVKNSQHKSIAQRASLYFSNIINAIAGKKRDKDSARTSWFRSVINAFQGKDQPQEEEHPIVLTVARALRAAKVNDLRPQPYNKEVQVDKKLQAQNSEPISLETSTSKTNHDDDILIASTTSQPKSVSLKADEPSKPRIKILTVTDKENQIPQTGKFDGGQGYIHSGKSRKPLGNRNSRSQATKKRGLTVKNIM